MSYIERSIDEVFAAVDKVFPVQVGPLDIVEMADELGDDPADRDDYRDDEGTFGDRYQDHIDNGVTPGDFA